MRGRSVIYADDIYLLAQGLNCDPCDFFRTEVEPAPIPSREDREHTPDYADAIYRGAMDRLDPKYRDVLQRLIELLESEGHHDDR